MSKKIILNILLLSLSAAISLYFAEAAVRLGILNYALPAWRTANQEEKFDPRSKAEVIYSYWKQGMPAYPALIPSLFVEKPNHSKEMSWIPLAGISNVPTVYCQEFGPWISYQSDSHGFNNPVDKFSSGSVDVILIGDSFVNGSCHPHEFTIAGQFEKHGLTVLNLGIAGNGPVSELASLVEYGSQLQSRVVLWFYFEGNDIDNYLNEIASPLVYYINDDYSNNLIQKQEQIDSDLKRIFDTEFRKKYPDYKENGADISGFLLMRALRNKLADVVKAINESAPKPESSAKPVSPTKVELTQKAVQIQGVPIPSRSYFERTLKRAKKVASSNGGKLYFVYLPEARRYTEPTYAGYKDDVLMVAKDLGIPVIDFQNKVDGLGDPLSAFKNRTSAHYSKAGYELLVKHIISSIKELDGAPK